MKRHFFFVLFAALFFSATLSAQWALQKTNAGDNYNTLWVDAVDANTVWASLDQNIDGSFFNAVNKVVRTVDGGRNWTTHTVGTDPKDFITSIYARSAQELWLVVWNQNSYIGKIFVTKNGGQTFEQKGLNTFADPGNYPDVIHFFDAQHGFAMGDPYNGEFQIYNTSDGGETWVQLPAADLPDPLPGEYGLQESYGVTGNVAVLGTSNNRVLRTPDRGQSWQAIDLPTQPPANTTAVMGAAFSDDQNGLLVYNQNSGPVFQPGSQPKPLRTKDAGLTWEIIDNSDGDQFDEFSVIVHVPGTEGTFLAGNYDGYAYTKDFGVTWKYTENKNFRMPGVDCVDANTCFGSIWSDTKNTGSKIGRWVGYQLANANPPGAALRMKATPNPATGPVTITFSQPLPAAGLLYMLDNSNTYLVAQQTLSVGQTTATFNIGSLTPGMYWLKAVVGNKVIMEKFFKN